MPVVVGLAQDAATAALEGVGLDARHHHAAQRSRARRAAP